MGDARTAPGQAYPSELAIPSPPVSPVVMSPQTEDMLRRSIQSDDGSMGPDNVIPYLPQSVYLCDLRHNIGVEAFQSSMQGDVGVVSKWRMKDRMKTSSVALVLCLNIGVDPPDVIKISPCARVECWLDPMSMQAQKALDQIGKNLQAQYERWQPRARYKVNLDPTVDEVKKLATSCRKNAKTERVLFHYNGHGVPKPTANGEIWLFNKTYTQYIPLSVYELETWLQTPSIYVFDCSAAGMIVNAFCERPEWGHGGSAISAMKETIILAACGAEEILPQNADLPADVFTACLTTPIKIALTWFCPRSLLKDVLDRDMIDKIPGRQNDRKTPLGELNWIFTAITDTIAWNVLPRELFQRLFRQDLLVASLFRNFLLAERVMRASNCTPVSHPRLPPTHQHPMWQAWDMAAEICLSQLPQLLADPNAEFQPSPFFTEQLTAFEVWLEHGSEKKKPPEQLPIVLQVLLSQSHRLRALVLLGRFLDMGAWAVDLALSVGIFPYVLKLLQTTAAELRQILVFIWTKILALDKSCQVDLVKDGGHLYFIKFLDSPDVYAEQRAMAAFVLAVIADSHPKGQHACIQADLVRICLSHIQNAPPGEPLLLQWLCLCLGKLWDGVPEGQELAWGLRGTETVAQLLGEPQPEVRAAAIFALGTLIVVNESTSIAPSIAEEDTDEGPELTHERDVGRSLLPLHTDGSPLVRTELVIALARLAHSHNKQFRKAAASFVKPPSHSMLAGPRPPFNGHVPTTRHLSYGFSPTIPFSPGLGPTAALMGAGSVGINLPGAHSPSSILTPTVLTEPRASSAPQKVGPGILREDSEAFGNGELEESELSPSGLNAPGLNAPDANGADGNAPTANGAHPKDDSAIYGQLLGALYVLSRDPWPRVANSARQTLRMVGVELVSSGPPISNRRGEGTWHGPVTQTMQLPSHPGGGLIRSTSWAQTSTAAIASAAAGNLSQNWRNNPTASPPTRTPSFLPPTPPSAGMRRVSSSGFIPSVAQNSFSGGGRGLGDHLPTSASSTALAAMATSPTSTHAIKDAGVLPRSTLFSWSCGHFSRPLLEPSYEEEEEGMQRRAARERMALEGISTCQHLSAGVSKVSDQIASCDTESERETRTLLLHPFVPIVCIADEKETIRIWNYEEGQTVNQLDKHTGTEKGVSRLCLMNELDDSLLMVASNDGAVRVWRNFAERGKQRLATAFNVLEGHRQSARAGGAVVDWQQLSGCLYASGEVPFLHVWDMDREMLSASVPMQTDASVVALNASQVHPAQLVAGCADGSVKLFDMRTRNSLVGTATPHTHKVVGVDFQPGAEPTKLVSASVWGDIQLLDMRRASQSYLSIEAHKGSMTALTVHRHAPVMASGSAKQYIKVFSMAGEQLSMVRYHNSFLGQRIGPVSCLQFHPYQVLLAAGATDSIVSIYAGESQRPR
ncbi:HEAT repeat protein [Klebsormidium nitens]|uniref:HEAT repeat protein n=1 Tax=Klebsormidium nitens TaxID=105231 RepID=A0A1Y1HY68_KLENI|nr:HEAT repeat protein [Klebsormidium nitens]|eukprot:GAQ83620.1 HEAT repeat protein [Klebsormidium nitens]